MPLPTPVAGPFYFAWCLAPEAFDAEVHNRMDELIFEFRLTLDEGQIPSLRLRMANRHIDVTNPTVPTYAWFSYDCGAPYGIIPLFFGRVVSVPDNIQNTQVEFVFINRAPDWMSQKTKVAWDYLGSDYVDPIWLEDNKRADPDALVEGIGKVWAIDPLTGTWSLSDMFNGEDGTIIFDDTEALWSSVNWQIKSIPKKSIRFDCDVNWTQRDAGGAILVCNQMVVSYGGGSLISEWPQPGTSVGGGWSVLWSRAIDVLRVEHAQNWEESFSWQNQDQKHAEGDTMSLNIQQSSPRISGIAWVDHEESKGAVLAGPNDLPGSQSDPSFSAKKTWSVAAIWKCYLQLVLQYKAERKRTEQLSFTLESDIQGVYVDPTLPEVVDVRKFSAADLSEPFINFRAWTLFRGSSVGMGQVIKPDIPTGPGGLSFQICITPGTAGVVVPTFSDIIGDTTTDGTVVWVCIGADLPSVGNWSPYHRSYLGEIIAPVAPVWLPYFATLGRGTAVSEGQIMRVDWQGIYVSCLIGGQTTGRFVILNPSPGAMSVDGSVVWITIGPSLNSGTFQICTSPGQGGLVWPPFGGSPGATCTDGSITWKSLGNGSPSIEMPIGGAPGSTYARSFFTTPRGQKSINYLLMLGRAELFKSARMVDVSWECSFLKGVLSHITLRKSATLVDDRLPAGYATGKIITAELRGSGTDGKFRTAVTIGCAVGKGGSVDAISGVSDYDTTDDWSEDYEIRYGGVVANTTNDITWGQLVADRNTDDGFSFPLTYDQVVISNGMVGNITLQSAVINSFTRGGRGLTYAPKDAMSRVIGGNTLYASRDEAIQAALESFGGSIYYQLALRPVTGQSFNNIYWLGTCKLTLPNQWG